MTNAEIGKALRELALRLEMEGVDFKPRAYEKAATSVQAEERGIEELYAEGGRRSIEEIPGVGRGIALKIEELLRTGQIQELEEMRRRTPADVLELASIEGLGPKLIRTLYEGLGIRTLRDLEQAAAAGRIRSLPHFGPRSEEKIKKGLELHKEARERAPIGEILELATVIESRLASHPAVQRATIAGSLRRGKETIGDLDFIATSDEPAAVTALFCEMPEVTHVHAHGDTKALVRLRNGIDADLRVVPEHSFGAALAYFTGSKAHNVEMRKMALARDLKLNEYGVFRGEERIAGATEEEVYEALGLAWVPPELREDRGELDAAGERRLPELLEPGDLKGDLQVQTSWTDGAASIKDMALAAREQGFEYIAITDHTIDLAMMGLDEDRLLWQLEEIEKVNEELDGIRVLSGAEVNIRKDGTLDISDRVLEKLDVVGAAVHHYFHLGRREMTRRLCRVMENPHVDILFHPFCRVFGKRRAVEVDLDAIFTTAKRTGTVLEIDAQPARLDLGDEHARQAIAAGVKLVISSDAHKPADFRLPRTYGVKVARRAGATKKDILTTLPVDELLGSLKKEVY